MEEPSSSICPACGSQSYVAPNRSISMSGYRTFDFKCTMVICGSCGLTNFYATNPGDTIAMIEKDFAEVRANRQIAMQERQAAEEAARRKAQKKGFF